MGFISLAMETLIFGTYRGVTAQLHKAKVMLMFPEGLMLKNTEGFATEA